jgi:D-amino-acid dehydrogenase
MAEEAFDAIVIAAGVDAADLMPFVGLKLPLLPVYGYSMTAPLRAPDRGPRGAVIDDRYGVVISRLGQRVRIAGGAEIGGAPERQRRAPVDLLFKLLHDWFPGAAHTAKPQVWKGARPMLADGPPIIGPSPRPGVWLNIGHGASGWALACGSARLLADQISGRKPALNLAPYAADRQQVGSAHA